MVKAFIGSNYLYVAFAFSQSGLWLGIVGMFLIAFLTDHCCHLIVKTKHHGIKGMMKNHRSATPDVGARQRNYAVCNGTPRDSGVDDDEASPCIQQSDSEDNSDYEVVNHADVHEHITKNMSYGDVGNLAYGSIGVGIVNFCIGLTQFGFCVNYFIFIGNTLHSLFPVHLCYNYNETNERLCKDIHETDVKYGNFSWSKSAFLPHDNSVDIYSADSPQDSLSSTLETVVTTVLPNITTVLPNVTTVLPTVVPNITTVVPNITTAVPNITTLLPNVTTLLPNTTTSAPVTNATTPWTLIPELVYTAPDLKILVVSPLIVFILFALIRNVRYLGVISMVANLSILFGCVSVLVFIIIDFKISESIVKFRIEGFPVFFGMVTGAFEGIGLVIPVESSMVGNRHLFSAFLHGAILFLTAVLGCFGILGYLKYGKDVHQMLNTNIPPGNPVSMAVNIGICLGILLTFPLQIYPVIEIIEKYLFSEGRICGPSKQKLPRAEEEGEDEALMPQDKKPLLDHKDLVAHVPDSVPAWKRNMLRISIVVVAAGLAVILKDNFAYVGAFVGAVGSSVLAFILPCLFHLRLCWHEIGVFIKVKDILIIAFGVFSSIISVVSVVERIVNHVDVG
ncbi:uncharacterized protein LOC123563758 isoform X2 [Mercenaria mercenaria]|nr:uncharacterized protein LOC123563758 isoform X2 [Mercenaria mercenaria]XP_053391558.1 uncharacterized protein LOC123563758 isoform X2 [Mercenaria mercenaria]